MAAGREDEPFQGRFFAEMAGNRLAKRTDVENVSDPPVTRRDSLPIEMHPIGMNNPAFARSRLTLEAVAGKLPLQGRETFENCNIETHVDPHRSGDFLTFDIVKRAKLCPTGLQAPNERHRPLI